MTVVDTSVLIDMLRRLPPARLALRDARARGPLYSTIVVRAEVLAGMRPDEEPVTRRLLGSIEWVPVDDAVTEEAGRLGRRWRRSHSGIDLPDLLVAATAVLLGTPVLTRNVRHFPMFPGLERPY